MLRSCFILKWLIIFGLIVATSASVGDNSPYYQTCLQKCTSSNCTEDGVNFLLTSVAQARPIYLILWTCSDECQYSCMWKTVEAFLDRGFKVPQFYGKWPFIRIFGMQEPASVLFSVFNFAAHYIMLKRFRREVRKTSPMYKLWHMYAMVHMNCWIWSSIFHTKDTPFTEKMDYFCAFSTVLYSFYAMLIRLLNGYSLFLAIVIAILCLTFFIHHTTYLSLVTFDYGYNMRANIVVGISTGVGWLIWCFYYRKSQPYVWRCAAFVLLLGVFMVFEVLDFPPVLWLIDAHSLWHLSTSGLPFIFYRFLIDDCKFLRKELAIHTVHND